MTRRQAVTTLLSLAITGGVLYLLLTDRVLADLGALLPRVDLRYVAAALCVGPVIQYLRAWRFSRLLWPADAGGGRPSLAMYRVSTFLLLFNYLLPFRAGELSFPLLVKQRFGVDLTASVGVLVVSRVLDLLVIVATCAIAAAVVIVDRPALARLGLAVAVLAVAGLALTPWVAGVSRRFLPPLAGRWTKPAALLERLLRGLHGIARPGQYLPVLALSVAIWLLQFVICLFCLRAVVGDAGYWQGMFAGASALLAWSLPINGVAGVGPVQAAWAFAAQLGGIDWSAGIASALLFSGVGLVAIVLLSLLVLIADDWLGLGRARPTA